MSSDHGLIIINGEKAAPDSAKISVFDRGFLFGDSVFETLVAFGDEVLDLNAHLERLRFSGEQLGMNLSSIIENLKSEIIEAVSAIHAPKKTIRAIISRGEGLSLMATDCLVPNRVIICVPSRLESTDVYKEGIRLKSRRSNLNERGFHPKSSNYLSAILAIKSAQKEHFDEILWTNASGEFTEAATSNIFLIGRDGDSVEIATPHVQSGLLAGITRAKLIDLLNYAKIPVTERSIYADELPRFDEAFVCSTVRGLVPISQIDQHRLHSARATSVFRHIERLFFALVHRDLGHRVDWNTGKAINISSNTGLDANQDDQKPNSKKGLH